MISKTTQEKLQREFDHLSADPDFQKRCAEANLNLRKKIAKKTREHRQFLARSREHAGHRVIR